MTGIIPENHAGRDSALPAPPPDAAVHSARLRALIDAEIDAAGGLLPSERYWELALYAPGLGYYSAGAQKFGAGGDFTTAPELSPLFARCLARQCLDVFERIEGAEPSVLEPGAGSGALAAELLNELGRLGRPPTRYCILEPSADLRARQRATLAERAPHWQDRVDWLDAPPDAGAAIDGVIVANEVLDALPVQRFQIDDAGASARPLAVGRDEQGGWIWRPADPDPALDDWLSALQRRLGYALPAGYVSERPLLLAPWLTTLASGLRRGAALLIDYGYPRREYYHPERRDGTLICHYQHRAHGDALLWPGLQDISASVDFSAAADALLAAGLTLSGYTNQSYFLFGCGLQALFDDVGNAGADHGADNNNAREQLRCAAEVKTLTLPGAMGERFKAIAATRGLDDASPLRGFSRFDQRHYL